MEAPFQLNFSPNISYISATYETHTETKFNGKDSRVIYIAVRYYDGRSGDNCTEVVSFTIPETVTKKPKIKHIPLLCSETTFDQLAYENQRGFLGKDFWKANLFARRLDNYSQRFTETLGYLNMHPSFSQAQWWKSRIEKEYLDQRKKEMAKELKRHKEQVQWIEEQTPVHSEFYGIMTAFDPIPNRAPATIPNETALREVKQPQNRKEKNVQPKQGKVIMKPKPRVIQPRVTPSRPAPKGPTHMRAPSSKSKGRR